jgi:hypothetical protein
MDRLPDAEFEGVGGVREAPPTGTGVVPLIGVI